MVTLFKINGFKQRAVLIDHGDPRLDGIFLSRKIPTIPTQKRRTAIRTQTMVLRNPDFEVDISFSFALDFRAMVQRQAAFGDLVFNSRCGVRTSAAVNKDGLCIFQGFHISHALSRPMTKTAVDRASAFMETSVMIVTLSRPVSDG